MRGPLLDREVLALLCDEPELLAIADAIVATQSDDSEERKGQLTERDLDTDGGAAPT